MNDKILSWLIFTMCLALLGTSIQQGLETREIIAKKDAEVQAQIQQNNKLYEFALAQAQSFQDSINNISNNFMDHSHFYYDGSVMFPNPYKK